MALSPANLIIWRVKHGFTVKEAANFYGVSAETYRNYENGRTPVRPPASERAIVLFYSAALAAPLPPSGDGRRPLALRPAIIREWQKYYGLPDPAAAAFLEISIERWRWYASDAGTDYPTWLSKVILYGVRPSDVERDAADAKRFELSGAELAAIKAAEVQKRPVGRPPKPKRDKAAEDIAFFNNWFFSAYPEPTPEQWAQAVDGLRYQDDGALYERLKGSFMPAVPPTPRPLAQLTPEESL